MPVLAPLGFALTLTHPSIFSQPPLIPKLTRNTQSWPPSPRPLWHYLCPTDLSNNAEEVATSSYDSCILGDWVSAHGLPRLVVYAVDDVDVS